MIFKNIKLTTDINNMYHIFKLVFALGLRNGVCDDNFVNEIAIGT